MLVKAIDTIYKGYKFRSRLEARWAVFFDTLRVEYWYEKEGFELETESGRKLYYLPDFFIPHLKAWIEIKGDEPNDDENLKAELLARASNQDVFIFYGDIPYPESSFDFYDGAHKFFAGKDGGWDCNYMWCECPFCGLLGIEFDGRSDRLDCKKCYICQQLEDDKASFSWVLNRFSIWNDEEKALLVNGICPIHPNGFTKGCYRTGANLDKGYNYNSPKLLNAYTTARQYRFEHRGSNDTQLSGNQTGL